MIKALIVDDDFLVRMFLKQLINWESQGFELVGDACGGEEALELIDRFSPELIITDLSMPGMDGIELIERTRARLPDSYIIALSCHGEFEYVKEAMKQGADEYVLKNLLDAPGLCKQLETARTKLESAARRAEQTDKLRQLAAKGTEMLRFEFLQGLLQDAPLSEEEQLRRCREAGLEGRFHACAALAAAAETARRDALVQVCGQFCRSKPAYCLPYDEHTCFIVLDLSPIASEAARLDWVRSFSEGLYSCIDEYLNVRPCQGVSTIQAGMAGLRQAVCQARTAIGYAFYDRRIHYAADLPQTDESLPEEAYAMLRHLPSMVEEGLFERICEEGQQVLSLCSRRQAPPEEVRRWFGDLLQITGAGGDVPASFEACTARLDELTQHLAEERGTGGGNRAIRQAAAYL
ncbi:MAG: response regulator, partial [Butyricicoccus sp.]